jgi:hypothetical protein
MKKIITFTVSVIIILVMTGIYIFSQRIEEPVQEERTPEAIPLIQREEHEAAEILFYENGKASYMRPFRDEFGRISWEYSNALGYRLNFRLVHEKARSARQLTAAAVAHENAAELDLAEFGLAPPAFVAEPIFTDGSRHVLKLGSRTTDLQHYFLMIDDDPAVYLINAFFGERLKYGVNDMLDMTLPFIDIESAVYVRIARRGAKDIVLELHGEERESFIPDIGGEQLIMREPLEGMALSTSHFMEYVIYPLSLIRLTELADIYPADLSSFGLESPFLEFVLRTQHDEIHWTFGDTFIHGGTEFVYMKVSDRPHVFIAESTHLAPITGLEPLDIAVRFLALVPIIDVESLMIDSAEVSYEMIMNHIPDTFDIAPSVNGVNVNDRDFRTAYRHIISLIADAEAQNFTPEGEPETTITFRRTESPDTVIQLYNYNANFLAVSIDGGEAVFVTNRLAVERILERVAALK